MADDLQKLLTYIVDRPLMQNESREAELDATAVRDVSQTASITKPEPPKRAAKNP